jgi:hypothetical protein
MTNYYTEARPEFNKPEGKIERIDFGEHTEEVKRIWSGLPPTSLVERWEKQGIRHQYYNAGTTRSRYGRIQNLLGYGNNLAGFCCICRNLNTHLLKYKISGATVVERFCEEHVPTR